MSIDQHLGPTRSRKSMIFDKGDDWRRSMEDSCGARSRRGLHMSHFEDTESIKIAQLIFVERELVRRWRDQYDLDAVSHILRCQVSESLTHCLEIIRRDHNHGHLR